MGGLVGKVIGATTIKESCAAIPVVKASTAGSCGGLVGEADGATFLKCYGNHITTLGLKNDLNIVFDC